MNNQVNNPFASNLPGQANQRQMNAVAQVESDRAMQEVQAAMVIAKKFPRNPIVSMDRILQSCTRKTLAEGALYSYSRGGTDVTGPSIRLAEAVAQQWGNIQFGVREFEQTPGVESVVEAYAWDLETNTKQSKVFVVPHKRFTKQGSKILTDSRDIYELVANNGSRRLRACILSVIPGDVIEEAVHQCEITLKQHADTSPEAIQRMVESFQNEFSVTAEQIQKRLNVRVEAIRPAQMVQMKKIYASLRDGMSQVSDWFDPAMQTTHSSIKTSIKRETQTAEPETQSAGEPEKAEPTQEQQQSANPLHNRQEKNND